MEIDENIAGLGKDHDQEAHENDLQKKQSEAQPGAENLEMEPNSVNMQGNRGFGGTSSEEEQDSKPVDEVHEQAEAYSKEEHEKADSWENTNETGPDAPQH
jgi:hypothetical protein